jgi:hypothetical protein
MTRRGVAGEQGGKIGAPFAALAMAGMSFRGDPDCGPIRVTKKAMRKAGLMLGQLSFPGYMLADVGTWPRRA